jgi:hypothetical protein
MYFAITSYGGDGWGGWGGFFGECGLVFVSSLLAACFRVGAQQLSNGGAACLSAAQQQLVSSLR